MKNFRSYKLIPVVVFACLFAAHPARSQSCLPRDAATLHSLGSMIISGTGFDAKLTFQGFLGDPVEGIFPVAKDENDNGESDVCEAIRIDNVGDLIAAPEGATAGEVPEIEVVGDIYPATDEENVKVVFWHDVEQQLYANEQGGPFSIYWPAEGGGVITVRYRIVDDEPTVLLYRTEGTNNGPKVDLSPVINGNPLASAVIHYNSSIKLATPKVNSDAYIDDILNELHGKTPGTFVLEYQNRQTGALLALEVVEIRNLVPVEQHWEVGSQVIPRATYDLTRPPEVTRGAAEYAYQHTGDMAASTKWNIYSVKPTTASINFEVYWFAASYGDVAWPVELSRYTADWPGDPQLNVRSEGGPPVDLSAHKRADILYQSPSQHAAITGMKFTTTVPGMATLMYSDDEEGAVGEKVLFEVVDTDDHSDHLISAYWDIGVHLEDVDHATECNDGFLFLDDVANNHYNSHQGEYLESLITYDPETLTGRVFPVNVGQIEMWWYMKSTTREGEPSQVCWPFKPVLYNCDWPAEPDRCIIISNQAGSGTFDTNKYQNPSIYEQGEDSLYGFNPNEEHAKWNTNPGDSILAARDDLNYVYGESDPYVLVQYQDRDQADAWEFDVIRVTREVPSGSTIPGCPCIENITGPCTFNYERMVGQVVVPPAPLGLALSFCLENTIITEPTREHYWDDNRGNRWFSQAGPGLVGTTDVVAEFYENWRGQGCEPWLDDGTGDPQDVTYEVRWPSIPSDPVVNPPLSSPEVYTSLDIGQTRDRSGFKLAEILHNEAGAVLIYPWKPSSVPLASSDKPADYLTLRTELPPHIAPRLQYDDVNQRLWYLGIESEGLLGIMSRADRDLINSVFADYPAFQAAVNALHTATQQPGMSAVGDVAEPDSSDWGIAVSSGPSTHQGWVVIGYNGRVDVTEPVVVEVFRVGCPPYCGNIQVVYPDCAFDEQITLRWSGDCGGDCGDLAFYWQVAAGDNPDDYEDIITDGTPTNPFNPWENYVDPERGGIVGWVTGQNEITIRGANVRTLTDNWFHVKTRGYSEPCGGVTESQWTDAQLAEGWIKRVKRGMNPFDQRVGDFTDTRVATYVSMIEQLGEPYSDVVAFSCDPEYVNSLGLIELYQAVLYRGKGFTIDLGVQYPPTDQALILMAGNLADFYMLLANEAYGDASDPTVGIGAEYQADPSAIFCFQNLLPSLIDEELALLRGRDDRDNDVDVAPHYNRLIWNFTQGDGVVAYVNNYGIVDKDNDQDIDEYDARIMFPQGHGDAWGHYLTAIKFYYDLLRHDSFNWQVRSEFVLVNQTPIRVGYAHERKFARAAAARAKCGGEILNLTYREHYVDNPELQWQGYQDPVAGRGWGVGDWARRVHMGAQFDWLVANYLLPATDGDPEHQGTLKKVDRTTVTELREIAGHAREIQSRLEEVDAGLNPLGLAKNVVPFDINPTGLDSPSAKSHFEQIYDRAVQTLNNAIVVFNHANTTSNLLRRHQDQLEDFENNVDDREADFNNRLIEIFGYPYPEDRNPITGEVYGPFHNGPDLYHWAYVDVEDMLGLEVPAGERLKVVFDTPVVDPETGVLSYKATEPVEFNRIPAFGLVKPREFTQDRKAPGEIQLSRSDLLQAYARLRRAIQDYDNLLAHIESLANQLQSFYNITSEEVALQQSQIDQRRTLGQEIAAARERQMNFQMASRMASAVATAVAEALPQNTVGGLCVGGDFTSVARSAIMLGGTTAMETLGRFAQEEALSEFRSRQQEELLVQQTQLEITLLRYQREAESLVAQVEAAMRNLNGVEIEIYAHQESVRQASGRYLGAIAKGERLLQDRLRFRRQTAAHITGERYKDMAFRVFRNDALQKYRAQFDLAARYVYLAAKAYDYETNLLNADSKSGEGFFTSIVRQRTIGQIEGGLPMAGRGLADILARLAQNFTVLKGQLGFNNPQTETNRFSLRRECFRIGSTGAESSVRWQETLERYRVDDLREHQDFRNLCDPLRDIVESEDPQPGIVIPFETNITLGLNFFGWPLSGGDSYYSSSNFATKIRSVGVWFSNYNNTTGPGGLTTTPQVFLVPAGADVMRVPTANSGKPRQWLLTDQVLPVPFAINSADLTDNRDWLPSLDNFGGSAEYGRPRRFGEFRAYHDGGSFNPLEAISESRLIGRSVWNTRWLLVIPGAKLLGDPEKGVELFIYGGGNLGDGVTDILIFFQTYAYTSGK